MSFSKKLLLSNRAMCAIMSKRWRAEITGQSPDAPTNVPGETSQPRITRQQPGKVLLGMIPADWPVNFHSRTGITGFGTFCFTFGIYLLSKEKLVMEHEYYGGLSMAVMLYLASTRVGPGIGAFLDKEIDEYEKAWNEGRVNERNMLEESIQNEETLQLSSEGQLMLLDAKRENVGLQLEANFRERQMMAYHEVINRLNYYIRLDEIERRFAQKNMVDWVTREVLKSITPEQETKNIDKCIEDLAAIAGK